MPMIISLIHNTHIKFIGTDRIWIMIDETQDAKGRNVAAFIVGSLDHPKKGPFLIHVDKLTQGCDTAGYKKFCMDGLNEFYPNGECI